MTSLFDSDAVPPSRERLEEGAVLLRGFAVTEAPALLEEVGRIARAAAFRHLVTPGGYGMSVAMTNCGRVGWVSDRTGYRYDVLDPDTGLPWPAMPGLFLDIAARATREAGFDCYDPDACLINRYAAYSGIEPRSLALVYRALKHDTALVRVSDGGFVADVIQMESDYTQVSNTSQTRMVRQAVEDFRRR